MDKNNTNLPILGNRYQIQQILGSGGMSVVYLARDLMLERPVAVKVLRQYFSRNDAFKERFHQEAKAAANLSHPNIVTVHDFGFDNNRLYIIMEYVPGQDLKSLIQNNKRFSEKDTIYLLTQACNGIGYAHRAGIVHCDIKPHNMIVSPEFGLKVTDFGIARAFSSIKPDEQSDVVWGSPQYFSPEQAAGLAPSPASDVYSLGVIMYEMITGRLPFVSDDSSQLAILHRDAQPEPPSKYYPDINPEVEKIILKVLSKEASSRYRTADQLGRILTALQEQYPSSEKESTPRPLINHKSDEKIEHRQNYNVKSRVDGESQKNNGLPVGIDWGTLVLALFTLLIAGGLIPFWLYIILSITSRHP